MIPSITREDLKTLIDSGRPMTLVEALPHRYYATEHLPGAINIPYDEIVNQAPALIPNLDNPVVVYCANAQCQNSHIAAQVLQRLGYHHVYQYLGGKADWKETGLAMESELEQI